MMIHSVNQEIKSMKKINCIFMLLLAAFLVSVPRAFSCTIIAAGKKATADGSVIISHTDTGPDLRIFYVPGKTFGPGEKAPVYWGIQDAGRPLEDDGEVLGYIPQVRKTYGYFQSAYSHMNEVQLGIAESTTAQRPELVCTREGGKQIMTIEQAMIFALQRCDKAREAVLLIGDLMTRYGFLPSSGDGSETLVIADTEEAWVFEVFGVGNGWEPGTRQTRGHLGGSEASRRSGDDGTQLEHHQGDRCHRQGCVSWFLTTTGRKLLTVGGTIRPPESRSSGRKPTPRCPRSMPPAVSGFSTPRLCPT